MTALRKQPSLKIEEIEAEDESLQIGQWYWYRHSVEVRALKHECTPSEWKRGKIWQKKSRKEPEIRTIEREIETLVCIDDLGSNYASVQGRKIKDDYSTTTGWRIHFDVFASVMRRELDPQRVLDEGRIQAQRRLNSLMDEVKEVTRRLGLADSVALGPATESALAVVADAQEPNRYKAELKLAKETTLPDLFKKIERASAELSSWLTATMIPLRAQAEKGREAIAEIDERIFSVELYAGMTEEVECICEGQPAAYHEKIHLIQGLRYMDEECLVNYEAGGMDFKDLAAFEQWLLKPHVRERLFPYQRTVCAFRIRRDKKDYKTTGLDPYIGFKIAEWHKFNESTFLYIRNGERMYRLSTEVKFEERLFPNRSEQIMAARQIWVQPHHFKEFLSDDDYQALKQREISRYEHELREWKIYRRTEKKVLYAYEKAKKAYEKARERHEKDFQDAVEQYERSTRCRWTSREKRDWIRRHPYPVKPERPPQRSEPRRNYSHLGYERVDPDSVKYDDMMKTVRAAVKQYNKIAIVLQGLLDRSPVLHPHPGWKLFTDRGLEQGVTLVFDTDRAITSGSAPDFEAYRADLNARLKIGDFTVGQQRYWGEKEAEKLSYSQRRSNYDREYYEPYGNEGPGAVAKIVALSRDRKTARYEWTRERLREPRRRSYLFAPRNRSERIKCHLSVPVDLLFNVSAYKPGDFHMFFDDPRTRMDYLKWAPMLLRAEDWHASKQGSVTDKETSDQPVTKGRRRSRKI